MPILRLRHLALPAALVSAGCATGDGAVARLKGTSILSWTPAQQRLGYPNIEKVAPVSVIRRGAVHPLPSAPVDLSSFTYSWGGKSRTLDGFLVEMNAVGVLALHDGRVVLERYAQRHTAADQWMSFSVAKSVTSLLYGAALRDGSIATLDDAVVRHVPELAGSAYEGVTLRHLLQMASGVEWNDDPRDPESDLARVVRLHREGGMAAQIAYMGGRARKTPPGTAFNYNTAETDLAGAILAKATGRSLAEYLSETVWQPFGMEADGYWLTMRGGTLERGGCCISATLRDYGRIGLFALRGGVDAGGTRRLPEGWMEESTRPSSASARYGYYWWLRGGGRYFASGSFGQHIEVSPAEGVVVAIQSYWPKAFDGELLGHNDAFVDALIRAVSKADP